MGWYCYDGCYYLDSSSPSHDDCSYGYWREDCCCAHSVERRHDCGCFNSSRHSNQKKGRHKMEDCRKKPKDECCKDCKKEKCDCCCVPGIKDQLREGDRVAIFVDNSFLGLPIAGRVAAVDCDTVLLTPITGSLPDIVGGLSPLPVRVSARFSLCDISAVFRLGS